MVDVYFMRASEDAGLSVLKISCKLISLQGYLFIPILQANFFLKSRRQETMSGFHVSLTVSHMQ